ncbi:MAG: lipoate--protein ligase family protein [Simkaniaceae bacterium]
MTKLQIITLKNFPVLQQLQLEEALLRADDRNFCLINQGSPKSIVLGISGNPVSLVHPDAWRQEKIPLIKRFSGGGTVIVDEHTLFVSFICEGKFINAPLFPEPILRWSTEFYQKAWRIPDFTFRENDYVIKDRKCGGNAQYIRKNRFVHHTTFLWDFQKKHMDFLLYPKKTPKYREGRGHADFLCRLRPLFPNIEDLAARIIEELRLRYIVESCSLEEISPVLQKEHRKSTSLLPCPQ